MGKYDSYIAGWQKRFGEQREKQQQRTIEMGKAAERCADLLANQFEVHRVYLFGSLAEGRVIHARSDIDLAVEGLPSHLYFKALSALWQLLPPGVELDLVPWEDAYDSMKEKIKTQGKLLYERKSF